MSSPLDSSLRDAAVTTFEQVVFLLPDAPSDESLHENEVHAVASIAFSGPAAGVLQVHVCEELLPRLVENMLGQDHASEAQQLDALGEIANIICGQIFPHLDPVSAFVQNPPRVEVFSEVPLSAAAPSARVELGLEGGRAVVLLYLDADAA